MNLDHYTGEFARAHGASAAAESQHVARMRHHALERFLSLGFPTTRDEEWRFTSVAPIASQAFVTDAGGPAAAEALDVVSYSLPPVFGAELVFVNGRYVPSLSSVGDLPPGVHVGSLMTTLGKDAAAVEPYLGRVASPDRYAFVALNTAFAADGAFISVPAHVALEQPIHLLFVSTGAASNGNGAVSGAPVMSNPRVLIVLGADSQASVVESYAGPEAVEYFTNTVTEIVAGDNAVLDHYKLQHEGAKAYHIGAIHAHAGRSTNITSHSVSLGGALVRNDVVAVLDGEGGECTLNGLYLGDRQRLVDNHTTIDHAKPHCGSREIYKGILADRARGVFNGKIIVRPDAQKTDAKQTNRALLLSDNAQINTKPQLEIFANDVKCTHGAAVGQLDAEAVFYLRSRGLGLPDARQMLIHAFAADVLYRMPLEAVRTSVERVLQHQLGRALAAAAA
jgi:Fe-S cluster assembly protein SufD